MFGIAGLVALYIHYFEEKPREKNLIEDLNNYNEATKAFKKSYERILVENKKVFIYTNDTSDLKLTMYPNIQLQRINGMYYDIDKVNFINDFLKTKSYGYNVHLNNGKENIQTFLRVYDSVIPNDSVKKFRMIMYFKMNENEKRYKGTYGDPLFFSYYNSVRKERDSLFELKRDVITFDELKRKEINYSASNFYSSSFNLERSESYVYFSSLNASATNEEFKTLFLSKKNSIENFFLRRVAIQKDSSMFY